VNHLGDTNKMVGETPRTDEAQFGTGRVSVSFARTLERELNAANAEIEEKRKDVVWLATEKAKLENRIKRLEEAGDAMVNEGWNEPHLANAWRKAKEAKL
jgi:predicted transcriptional regulator